MVSDVPGQSCKEFLFPCHCFLILLGVQGCSEVQGSARHQSLKQEEQQKDVWREEPMETQKGTS